MKILSVVGARPQFIKAAVVSHELNKNHTEVLVHTGQHFDYNMSEKFFEELDIPKPKYNLGISGGSHCDMIGRMLMALEKVMVQEQPDMALLYGDTNSTLAAALCAAKLHIPIVHVEAGTRTHNPSNQEEMNRICTDHLSTKLLVCTESGMDELSHEGLIDRGELVGDPMYDAFVNYSGKVQITDITLSLLSGKDVKVPSEFYYLTCHREENTNDDSKLASMLDAMNSLDAPTIYPVHPRNKQRALRLDEQYHFDNVILCEPVGYLESVALTNNAKKIVTDSGGLQREAFFAGKKCVTVLDFVVWQETMVDNRNELAKPDKNDIIDKLSHIQKIDDSYQPFGDGRSAIKIVKAIESIKY